MPAGRPTKMTESTIGKLEEAFAYDSTVEEACFLADINPDTYYSYVKEHPEFSERVAALRQRPILAARKAVVDGITEDVKHAQWYLERKVKNEFSPRNEHTFKGDDPVRVLLDAYGVTEGSDAREANPTIQSPPEGEA